MSRSTAPIPYPEPPLAGAAFVLRPFREDDFDAALELEQDAAAARWVPELPAADGAGVVAFYEECRRDGGLLHLVIADRVDAMRTWARRCWRSASTGSASSAAASCRRRAAAGSRPRCSRR